MSNELVSTEPLVEKINHILESLYCISIDLNLNPAKEHHINFINYVDLQEMRKEFINSLFSSVTRYVYSEAQTQKKIKALKREQVEISDAFSMVQSEAIGTFKVNNIKGQFSELLLFNLLQHHFKAVPLVRKMPITTNPALERNGADAFHISVEGDKTVLYLGEAKTYTSGLRKAFQDSLDSLMKTYKDYRSELNLYVYNDFINPQLKKVAKNFLAGKHDGEIHMVALISFERPALANHTTKADILKQIIEDVKTEASKITVADYSPLGDFPAIRLNYVFLPFQELNTLISEFQSRFK